MSAIQDSPQLSVTDFGPIQEANIDLRPLSVFIGPSNTGKSYLAILIYALHRYFGNTSRSLLRSKELRAQLNSIPSDVFGDLVDSVLKMSMQPTELEENDFSAPDEVVIPEPVATVLRTMFREAAHPGFQDEISRCFGLDAKMLCRRDGDGNSRVIFRTMLVESTKPIMHRLTLESKIITFETDIPHEIPLKVQRGFPHAMPLGWRWLYSRKSELEDFSENDNRKASLARIQFLRLIADYLARDFYEPFGRSAYYLPADRTGIMHAHKAVVSAVLGNAAMAGIRRVPSGALLSGILADFLEGLIVIDDHLHLQRRGIGPPQEILNICEEIEGQILRGSITTENSETLHYPQFSYQPKGWPDSLPLINASSMVSELASVLLYLRHRVDRGDVLIIEEPESHLHPFMQVQFTRQLAAIVNAGVRVIITTHSEWVLEELANLVRLSLLPESDRATIGGGSVALDPDKVGAWLFQQGKGSEGSTVSQINLDDSGLYPSGFDDVAIALHNNWARISSQLE